jgi:hypothetical protein
MKADKKYEKGVNNSKKELKYFQSSDIIYAMLICP